MDIVSPGVRSRMMASIRGKDTQPELTVRRYLHARGFRYRLHGGNLLGRPDLVLPRWKAVVFVHGCFWHGHAGCKYFRLPATRVDFWTAKISGTIERDAFAETGLRQLGWRVFIVWECALRDRQESALCELERYIRSGSEKAEVQPESAQLRLKTE